LSLAETERPHFLIIAGPNGSGKSSAYQASVAEVAGRTFRIINPDTFSSRLAISESLAAEKANLEAVRRIEQWLETSILAGHTVGVETVLSTSKYRRLIQLAQRERYRIQLIYVILDDPRRNVERVAIRVRRGGHGVPETKIIERYWRSLEQLPWFLANADEAWLWDNSGATIRAIGEKSDGRIKVDERAPSCIIEAANEAARLMD
jgi:predicted ABC-type ATPase